MRFMHHLHDRLTILFFIALHYGAVNRQNYAKVALILVCVKLFAFAVHCGLTETSSKSKVLVKGLVKGLRPKLK